MKDALKFFLCLFALIVTGLVGLVVWIVQEIQDLLKGD